MDNSEKYFLNPPHQLSIIIFPLLQSSSSYETMLSSPISICTMNLCSFHESVLFLKQIEFIYKQPNTRKHTNVYYIDVIILSFFLLRFEMCIFLIYTTFVGTYTCIRQSKRYPVHTCNVACFSSWNNISYMKVCQFISYSPIYDGLYCFNTMWFLNSN